MLKDIRSDMEVFEVGDRVVLFNKTGHLKRFLKDTGTITNIRFDIMFERNFETKGNGIRPYNILDSVDIIKKDKGDKVVKVGDEVYLKRSFIKKEYLKEDSSNVKGIVRKIARITIKLDKYYKTGYGSCDYCFSSKSLMKTGQKFQNIIYPFKKGSIIEVVRANEELKENGVNIGDRGYLIARGDNMSYCFVRFYKYDSDVDYQYTCVSLYDIRNVEKECQEDKVELSIPRTYEILKYYMSQGNAIMIGNKKEFEFLKKLFLSIEEKGYKSTPMNYDLCPELEKVKLTSSGFFCSLNVACPGYDDFKLLKEGCNLAIGTEFELVGDREIYKISEVIKCLSKELKFEKPLKYIIDDKITSNILPYLIKQKYNNIDDTLLKFYEVLGEYISQNFYELFEIKE